MDQFILQAYLQLILGTITSSTLDKGEYKRTDFTCMWELSTIFNKVDHSEICIATCPLQVASNCVVVIKFG